MTRWFSHHAQGPSGRPSTPPGTRITAPSLLAAILIVAGAGAAAPTQAQGSDRVYVCEGPNGTPLFQNTSGKGCRLMDLPPINSVPAPKLPAAANRAPTAAASNANRNFPRVDPAAQRDRDGDRQRLLNDELKREQDRLAELKREFNGGEPERRGDERNYQKYLDRVETLRQEIGRSESSVSSLERELGVARN